jgi:2-polyprenyl-6-hydroxyphenyl methylase/3-demethylubiquinone-9 3-methyltransferase
MPSSNVDIDEIEKFSSHSQEWWRTDGAFSALHHINPLRLSFIETHLSLKDCTILDIGCGGGILSEALAQKGARVTGIDLSAESLAAAKAHRGQLNIDYQQISAEDLAALVPQTFDAITCMEMLEHVPDPEAVIIACATLLKPSGKLFLSTLNRNIKSYLFGIIGAEYILKLLPKGTHDYAKFIKPSELSRTLRHAHFSVNAMKGISYYPLTKKYSLTKDISVNYLLYAQKN